jgi:hypothetical protein
MAALVRDEIDRITPVGIDHRIDEIWADQPGGRLMERYNYLDYHFERDGQYCRARTYVDEPNLITLFGPFVARGSIARVEAPEFEADVSAYLARRFRSLNRM